MRPRRRIRLPLPEVLRQRSEFLAQFDGALGVVDRRLDLAAMANDAFVAQQPADIASRVTRDAVDVEAGKRAAEVLPFPQDRDPAQARLKAFETDLLEQTRVVFHALTPFMIVILDVERIGPAPPAALHRHLLRTRHLKIPRILLPIAPKNP